MSAGFFLSFLSGGSRLSLLLSVSLALSLSPSLSTGRGSVWALGD